jgi:hypothetical protein
MAGSAAVLTIISKNYLPYARTLMNSVRQADPSYGRIVVLADTVDGYFTPDQEPFTLVTIDELPIPDAAWMEFQYTLMELNTAVKPYAITYAFERLGIERLIYLDPDIYVYSSLQPIVDRLEEYHIILTPHLLEPVCDAFAPGEKNILIAGTYNLGFIAVKQGPVTRGFLAWWAEKTLHQGYVEFAAALFTDQKWLDLVPGLFPGVYIERDPGYNVAYWDIAHRQITQSDGGYRVNGRPLRFFHFSALDVTAPEGLSRYQNRTTLAQLGAPAEELVRRYAQTVMAAGFDSCRHWPYAFGCFQNGVPVVDICRRYARFQTEVRQAIGDPFSDDGFRAYSAFWNQPIGAMQGKVGGGATRLLWHAYALRLADMIIGQPPEVQQQLPYVVAEGYGALLEWFLTHASGIYKLTEHLITPVRMELERFRPPRLRKLLAGMETPQQADLEVWLSELIEDPAGWLTTRLGRRILDTRPDLQRRFRNPAGANSYLRWLLTSGAEEYGIPAELLNPLYALRANVYREMPHFRRVLSMAADSLVRLRHMVGMMLRRGRH